MRKQILRTLPKIRELCDILLIIILTENVTLDTFQGKISVSVSLFLIRLRIN